MLPTTVAGVRAALQNFSTVEGERVAKAFKPRPDDVFIATYPKCGTTWVQQIVHSLRTNGDLDFGEITEVVPWLELCHDLHQDPNAEQRGSPRAFKSHYHGGDVPDGARYINVTRDPFDVLASFYHFFSGWFFAPGSIDINEFAEAFFLSGTNSGRYWDHVVEWWKRRDDPSCLLLCYEDMRAEPEAAIRRIANFVGYGNEENRIQCAIEQSSFAFMSQHQSKYDDHFLRHWRNEPCGLPIDASSSKVRTGKSGGNESTVSEQTRTAMQTRWQEDVESTTGLADYQALRSAMAARA